MKFSKIRIKKNLKTFYKSVWLFPVLLLIPVIVLTSLKISGSSIGVYNSYFNGVTPDKNLLFGKPRVIRSDEWVVNTQMTLAQKANNFNRVNTNIGNGQDFSLLIDAPYKDWSVLFKPHNLVFFIMPFDYAFALRWWLLGYMLIVSTYFLVLKLLGDKRLVASLISISLFFSPFVQWWYLNGTLSTITYALLATLLIITIINERSLKAGVVKGMTLTYVLTCFLLILYPPFQIPAVVAVALFILGYTYSNLKKADKSEIIQKITIVSVSAVSAVLIVGLFIFTRYSVVSTIQNTSYPGKRVEQSGKYDKGHLLSSFLSPQFQFNSKAAKYTDPSAGLANQSENSNFLLILPYLIIPSLILIYRNKKRNTTIEWELVGIIVSFLAIIGWMLIPNLSLIGKLTLFDKVPANRFIIGLGILNILGFVLFLRAYIKDKHYKFGISISLVYCFMIFIINYCLGLYSIKRFPGFISPSIMILLSLVYPLVLFLILRKRIVSGLIVLVIFSIVSSAAVNPLYKGTSVITDTLLSQEIQKISLINKGRWATDESMLENFASLNGARSLSGVFAYPQLDLWQNTGVDKAIYNRYAHTNFVFDRDVTSNTKTTLKLQAGDNFGIFSEPCSDFLNKSDVDFILTRVTFDKDEKCIHLLETVRYPDKTFYIYKRN